MKKIFYLTIIALFATPLFASTQVTYSNSSASFAAEQQKKWFFQGSLEANVLSSAGESVSTVGIGAGIHGMLNENVSLGLNLSLADFDGITIFEGDLVLAGYAKLAERLYYVPEVYIGAASLSTSGSLYYDGGGYSSGSSVEAFGAGISLFGLEFRPTDTFGCRVGFLNLTYIGVEGEGLYNFGITPKVSIILRF